MIDRFFSVLHSIDAFYWSYVGATLIVGSGLFFSFQSHFYQFRVLIHLPATVRGILEASQQKLPGLSPLRLYFASIGGMIGLGNIVAVITALMLGGPGALFWLWVAAFAGMLIKYAEIYIGMQHRIFDKSNNCYHGGPMYYAQRAFRGPLGKGLAIISAILLCIYGVEIYQFTVVTDSFMLWPVLNREYIIWALLAFTLYIGLGGVKRLANICTWMMPLFIIVYIVLCSWVILLNVNQLPSLIVLVVKSAFQGHAPLGGFVGSTFLMAAQQGIARAVYSADIAIGFDSIIQSESRLINPQQQARLAILSTITDAIICSLSMVVVLITGLWHKAPDYPHSQYVAKALSIYIPYVHYLMVVIIFLAAFTTIQSYFVVGIKSAQFLSAKWGKKIYFCYAIFSFWFFAHYDQTKVSVIMTLSSGFLVLINLSSIFKLYKEIKFNSSS